MRSIFSTYISAIKLLFYKWRAWIFVYICNFIFALLIALPFKRILDDAAGHSDAALGGLESFDSDFIGDLLNNYGSQFSLWGGQIMIFVSIYLLLNIFLSGGLIENYVHLFQRFSMNKFFADCTKHFLRLLRLALYFIGAQVAVVFVLWTIYVKLGISPFEMDSDFVLITRTRVTTAVMVILIAWIDLVHEYAKVKIVTQKESGFILPTLVRMKFFVLRHLLPILGLFILCVVTFLVLLGIYSLLNNLFTMQSTGAILLAFLVGQIYLIFRVGTRLLFTTSAVDYMRFNNWAE